MGVIASELRAGEYAQAQMCLEHINKPNKILEREIWPSAHDAMNIGHNRTFKRLGCLSKERCPPEMDMRLRIYDYEESQGQKVTAYQYDNGRRRILPNEAINFAVAEKHIRFLILSKETFPGSRKRWAEFASDVRVLGWVTWEEAMGRDVPGTVEIQKIACAACVGRNAKLRRPCAEVAYPMVHP